MRRFQRLGVATLLALVLALPTSAALAAHLLSFVPHHPQYFECQYTNETDNIQVNNGSYNPFRDDLDNQWVIYYDITRDVHDNVPCEMRVVMRIFNPSPNGAWHGTADVYAYVNGYYNSYSFGKVSGSGTYQYHFVWRGPWFGADYGFYQIEIDEFNGSNTYLRAFTTFWI